MRILLNLLPEEKKEYLVRRFRYRFFLWQTMLIVFLQIYYVAALGGIYMILNFQVQVGNEALVAFDQFNAEAKQLVGIRDKFKETNALVDTVVRYEQSHLHWSALLVLFQKLTPEGVVLLEVLTKDYTVSLTGQALTREHFLSFESALKGDECVSDVRVPISNLFTQKEVDFQIDFKIKKECLLNR